MPQIEINPEFQKALDIIEGTGKNLFLTGRAGTGKSTLLQYFRETTKKKIVVLAPTGVAALNVKGQTIHSFFGFRPTITPDKVIKIPKKKQAGTIYKKLDAIIIDEISMVRADLLDCVEKFMRFNGKIPGKPFGGVQMVFIGDLFQIPPVVTKDEKFIFSEGHYASQYFFHAKCMSNFPVEFVELEKIYRQQDERFIQLLNRIRNNSVDEKDIALLNSRVIADFKPPEKEFFICLTPRNDQADEINRQHLDRIKSKKFIYQGSIDGNFDEKSLPAKKSLELKAGAQVMMLNNDSRSRWVNGSVGKIEKIIKGGYMDENDDPQDVVMVKISSGEPVAVTPYTWELYRFSYDEKKSSIKSETVGTFTQYPMMLAWAVTIHKSQGKTFDRVIIDIGKGAFAHGQVYVALSRCTTLEGIVLIKPIQKNHIWVDYRVVKFMTGFRYGISEKIMPLMEKISFIERAIREEKILDMTYLKSINEKSERQVKPVSVGQEDYKGYKYWALRGFDSLSGTERNFNVAKILDMDYWEKEV
ncbi:MAG: AAA family ATPase [Bacteroidetes bacterium]|nr:AAA family ATPase [Bacteroidota bacterium]